MKNTLFYIVIQLCIFCGFHAAAQKIVFVYTTDSIPAKYTNQSAIRTSTPEIMVVRQWKTKAVFPDEKEVSEQTISLYPNPAANTVKVEASNSKQFMLQIFGQSGREVLCRNIQRGEGIDVSKLVPGIYVAQITAGEKKFTRKLFINR